MKESRNRGLIVSIIIALVFTALTCLANVSKSSGQSPVPNFKVYSITATGAKASWSKVKYGKEYPDHFKLCWKKSGAKKWAGTKTIKGTTASISGLSRNTKYVVCVYAQRKNNSELGMGMKKITTKKK